jgi:tRNA(Arg) A34 adenosine deaminase TadA
VINVLNLALSQSGRWLKHVEKDALPMCTKPRFALTDTVSLTLPKWLADDILHNRIPESLPTIEDQMAFAIDLSRRNAAENTGGPFGSVIIETKTGLVKGVGVNRVVPVCCSILHGETVAIAMAQAAVGNFNLGADGLPGHTLVTSAQPCAMCSGATVWSGVEKLVTGASGQDVEELTGFDEGPIHPDWANELRKRKIEVIEGVLRDEARAALQFYVDNGGFIYNGGNRNT